MDAAPTIEHLVFYQTNRDNPRAVDMIVDHAYSLLQGIPSVKSLKVGVPMQTGRVVSGQLSYNVSLHVSFASKDDYHEYMSNPSHLRFVEFVLKGWMLKGSALPSVDLRQAEFIENILYGTVKREWEIDPAVPCDQRVWQDERVFDDLIIRPKIDG